MYSNKKFGYFFSFIFFVLSIFFLFKKIFFLFLISFCFLITLFLVTIFKQSYLSPFNRLWYLIAKLLNILISPLILGFLYFFILTPYAIVLRLFGRDELKIRNKMNNRSYWIKSKEEIKYDLSFFKKQY